MHRSLTGERELCRHPLQGWLLSRSYLHHSVPDGYSEGTVPAEHPGVLSGPAGGFGDVPAS